MHCGLPLIITDPGGLSEYTGECAIVEKYDKKLVDNIKENIELLRRDMALRVKMSEEGRTRAGLFTRKKFYDDFVECFENWN